MSRRSASYVARVRETVTATAILCQTYGHWWDPTAADSEIEHLVSASGKLVGQIERLRCQRCKSYRRFEQEVDRRAECITTVKRRYNHSEGYQRPRRDPADDGPRFSRGNAAFIHVQLAFPDLKI